MNTDFKKTKRELRAQQIAALVAEQEAEDKAVKESMKHAAFARCDAVQQLYQLLGIAPESPRKRQGQDGVIHEVAQDRDETKRAARLVAAVASLSAGVERSGVEPQRSQSTAEHGSESAASAHHEGYGPVS